MTRSKRSNAYTSAGNPILPGQRIGVGKNVFVPDGDISERNDRDVFVAREQEILMNKRRIKGLSKRNALLLLSILAAVFGFAILQKVGTKMALNREISKLNSQLVLIDAEINDQYAEVINARDSARICYKAVQEMGMVNGNGADTVYITLQGKSSFVLSDTNPIGLQTGMNGI